ncbi:glycosyltransferase [Sporomusa acidovorans]|uniref:Glycosyltransferase n=1 Tax=Sporomusa acidovorans (strain ATCC 49682 / DSM 3132 / Mol) TaxID=1123286 RepID=A0ABZ3J2H2_SPOA4|nr:glycosyltransferase [Sporomusa acidovorans]OZC19726.1 hypothetical protein SPACI_27920 [Sporomusa acidovorans DSM 3132]SDF76035.1 hypothetical protein SAMN04488499_107812 [Sporomusa acidovorans]
MIKSELLIDESHIFRMTDSTGMLQHTRWSTPDYAKGYTTDDNARALIMAVMLYEQQHQKKYLELVYRYLAFILHAQNETGRFRNFMTYERKFTEIEGSEDCFGRCLWALGYTMASPAIPQGIKDACLDVFRRALHNIQFHLHFVRGKAYSVIALEFLNSSEVRGIVSELAAQLADAFATCATDTDWQWFENKLTYDNAVLPWAMFIAYRVTNEEKFLKIAQDSLSFLDKTVFRSGFFWPVGCKGWWLRGKEPALYDQQPVEAAMSTLAHLAAFAITGERTMLELAQKSFAWYSGENSLRKSLIDPDTGGCFDGITPEGINRNQGAESIVSYVMANLAVRNTERLTYGSMEGRV